MYAITSTLLVRRTRQTLRSAEFGFFGVVVYTRVQTPRRCGERCSAGTFDLYVAATRPPRISWLVVDIPSFSPRCLRYHRTHEASGRPLAARIVVFSFNAPPVIWGRGPKRPAILVTHPHERQGRPGLRAAGFRGDAHLDVTCCLYSKESPGRRESPRAR